MSSTSDYTPVYHQGDPGTGIGGYDLKSSADTAFAFDYDSSGKLDHIVLYRPGTGTCWILKKGENGVWSPVYHQGDPGNGIGGYDLKSPDDRIIPFDYDHSGKADHLVCYRPGTGTIWILKNRGGMFSAVYAGESGIGGYDLKSKDDLCFAYDYDRCGRVDYLALYRPGTGTFWILKHESGKFTAVYNQGDPGKGIGGYDLKSPADRAFAFDWEGSDKLDSIVLYRPGTGTIWILRREGTDFTPVYQQGDPGQGIGGYDLKSARDICFPFAHNLGKKLNELVLYRPGTGTLWIVKKEGTHSTPVYRQGDPGLGIGGYDLKSPADRCFALDYNSNGNPDHLVLYRPGTGTIWILRRVV
ncbi:hypothetical protein GLOTRDRAFT_92616 [Gloeophyllum trabeum ATCC 11539]|uniref:Uncharacterized protein n=1 Tax=Gloeophyllum trabeum (strain ATCC 11539 / FP-39264 / Madison 617) TaxID=670483 RepID=S7RWF0_GLOTA|nr:uncharacterized protein GLOTRDRAFT_92616 [Gloeophyllum trabeum ATCC 11539]EPQ57644.1 hypothetical protein GLOTRDRAFT_92616 [Gloeophyllum trabeum ATCC 11539]